MFRQQFGGGQALSGEPEIDARTFEALKASMGETFDQLVSYFVEDLRTYRAELIQAFESKAFADIKRIAHTIKSSSQMFGCNALSAMAREIEAASAQQDVSRAKLSPFLASLSSYAEAIEANASQAR